MEKQGRSVHDSDIGCSCSSSSSSEINKLKEHIKHLETSSNMLFDLR